MSTEQLFVVAIILAPVIILGVVGMIRGYHLHLKVWKHNKEDGHGND